MTPKHRVSLCILLLFHKFSQDTPALTAIKRKKEYSIFVEINKIHMYMDAQLKE